MGGGLYDQNHLKLRIDDYYRKVLFCRPNYKGFKHL